MANSDVTTPPPMGASWIGTWQPTRSVKAVRSMPGSMAPEQLLAPAPPRIHQPCGFVDVDFAAGELAASRARLVEFFWADPDPALVELVHAGGALAGWQVGSVEEAERAADAGCDLVIAQGVEAGGHVRGTVALLPLLAGVLEVVTVPVLAAGGIASARSMAAVLAA
ncbi:MAG TPA: nitronate monooxygenase, partial [Actinomycetota bacterium]|nr:nitronate monooxygenase [Actinomycetota bacterium]